MFQCGLDIFAALMNNQLTRGLAIPCSLGCFDVTCFFIMKKADMEEKMSAFLYEKAQCGVESTLSLVASHEARRRMAVTLRLSRFPSSSPARHRRAVRGQGVLPLARGPLPSGGISQSTHMSLYTPARRRRAVRGQGVLPLAQATRPVSERRYLRSQLTCLPMPLRAAGAQSERGTQSPILPRTMKRAPSKV